MIDKRLLGTWQSDRRRTFRDYVLPKKMTAAQRRRYKALFGKLIVRWTARFCFTQLDDSKWKDPYELIGRDSVSVVVRAYNEVFEETRLTQVFFENNHYWFWTPWGSREFFRRIPHLRPE